MRLIVTIACLSVITTPAKGEDDKVALLDAMRKVDAVYAAALNCSGTDNVGQELLRPGDMGGKYKWEITRNLDETTLRRTRIEGPAPVFVPKDQTVFADFDKDGNVLVNVLEEEVYHFSPEERFRLLRYVRHLISPTGSILSSKPYESVTFFAADDPEPSLAVKRALWSIGRGFSPFLDQIEEIKPRENGQLALQARGFESQASRGIWRLVVDPTRSYLVTEAAYTRDGRSDPTISLRNAGSKIDGACEVAESAEWIVNVGGVNQQTLVCDQSSLRVDDRLLQFGRNSKQGPFSEDVVALDKRSGVTKVLNLRPSARQPLTELQLSTSRTRLFLLLLNGHILIGLFAYWCYRRYRIRLALGSPS